jgi:hypothetical protein
MTTFLTILVITFIDGSTYEQSYDSARACADAIPQMEAKAAENGFGVDMVQCIKTPAPTTSPVPKRRPEVM